MPTHLAFAALAANVSLSDKLVIGKWQLFRNKKMAKINNKLWMTNWNTYVPRPRLAGCLLALNFFDLFFEKEEYFVNYKLETSSNKQRIIMYKDLFEFV